MDSEVDTGLQSGHGLTHSLPIRPTDLIFLSYIVATNAGASRDDKLMFHHADLYATHLMRVSRSTQRRCVHFVSHVTCTILLNKTTNDFAFENIQVRVSCLSSTIECAWKASYGTIEEKPSSLRTTKKYCLSAYNSNGNPHPGTTSKL